jgi:hypothetical protein
MCCNKPMTGITSRMWTTAAAIALVFGSARTIEAGEMTFTSSAAFNAAIAGYSTSVENYSGFTAGTLINAGDTFDGLTYSAFTPGPSGTLLGGIITNQFNNFSGLSLGGNQSTGAQFFFGGDSATVTFATPVNAFALFFNVNLNSGNYGFTTSVGSATTGSASYDTDTFVFAGLVSTTLFTSATFFSTDDALGSYNIPEIITATVPEPSTLALGFLSMAILGGAVAGRGRRAATAVD